MDLPNNLKLNTFTGELFCSDGTPQTEYIKDCAMRRFENTELPIVILRREDYLYLCKKAWGNDNLVQAA